MPARNIVVLSTNVRVPDRVIGVSALSFMGRVDGARALLGKPDADHERTAHHGIRSSTAALRLYGIKRIGILSPHPAMFDEHYVRFFSESGYEVATLHRIDCPTTLAIAMIEEATIRAALHAVVDAGSEIIVQVGTDLVFTRLADEAERWLGRPVIAVNAAMFWHAVRAHDIQDRLVGLGSILRTH